MKAVTYTSYGPAEVLQITDIEKPKPQAGEVLINVYYSTVNRTDCGYRSAQYFVSRIVTGLLKPKYPVSGSEFAGEIVEVGESVTEYNVGDKVFGFDDVRGGAHAEFVAKPVDGPFALIPDGYDYAEVAAAGEGATYALSVINAVGITKGQNVMVYGASGAIGSAALQILKHLGAEVTAVCGTKNVDVVRSLNPDRVISYETEDFTKDTEIYDFVFDAVGKSSYGVCKKLLTPHGTYYSSELGKGAQNPLLALWFGLTGSRRVIFPIPKINKENIEYLKTLIEAGDYLPLIDRTYRMDEIVEATRYVESGQKVGNVLIKII